MPGYVVGAVLFAALLHASWNALVKGGNDSFLTMALVSAGAALASALALPFIPAPAAASLPFLAASAAVQCLYYYLLTETYRHGDMSHSYPLMRGSAPLIVALASAPLLGERLGALHWLAIACICGGILLLYFTAGKHADKARRTTIYALLTACTIAIYTLIDGIGVRKSGSPFAYTMWLFVLTGIGVVGGAVQRRPGQLLAYAKARPAVLLVGGTASLGSYAIALWAMTLAPVAAVAALRETSILFATAIAALVLREKIGAPRAAAVGLVALGSVAMRIA